MTIFVLFNITFVSGSGVKISKIFHDSETLKSQLKDSLSEEVLDSILNAEFKIGNVRKKFNL